MEKSESTKIDVVETNKERKGKAPLLGTAAPVVAAAATAEHAKGGAKRGIAIFDLILRIAAFASALGAAVAMGTTEETLPFFTQFFQFEASYDDLPTFTFFVVAMAIVVAYLVLSVPFSIVCIVRPYAVVIIALATGAAGSAAAIVYLAHNGNQDANWLAICQQFGDFCQRASGAVVAAFITVVILIFMVVLSASALRRH
ncbi:hypothetical protein RND71_035982 [Anisodus tanguticus]|uniref:CASP-like protein n=1 Tax=Anisodus tanguticus TaxID=243964 RepID=A0AAE1V081_9SOLA|nr:hypothetical protein RND71_035982 [Anisodus tanguticus]